MIDSRLSLAASCNRSTRFFSASCTSPIAFLRLYQLPEAPPPPLLPPPKPPNPPPPPLRPLAALCPARAIDKIIQMMKTIPQRPIGDECRRSFCSDRDGGWPDSVTPRSSAIYFASIHVAVSIAVL